MNRPKKIKRNHFDIVRSEEALVGSVIIDPTRLDLVPAISGKNFFDDRLGKIFNVCRQRYEAGQKIDAILLLENCRQVGIDITAAEIGRLFVEVPHASHASYYGDNVGEADRIRRLEVLIEKTQLLLSNRGSNSRDVIELLESEIETIRGDQQSSIVSIADAGKKLLEECNAPKERNRSAETGITPIDCKMGGLMPGEMVVLAARPGNGKTSLGMQVARHNATLNRRCLFVSLEMRAEELAARFFASEEIPMDRLRTRELTTHQTKILSDAIEKMNNCPISIADPATATMRDIRSMARSIGNLSLIVIDYLSLVSSPPTKSQRWEQVGEISRSIKRLAKELRVPILILQQLNREADGLVPRLSHLRESGSIEQDADIVCFLHSTNESKTEFIIAKHRHGPTDVIPLYFDGERTRFSDNQFSGFEAYS